MSRLILFLRALFLLFRHPWLANHFSKDNELWRRKAIRHFGPNPELPVVYPYQLSTEKQFHISQLSMLDGGSLMADYMLLQMLARKIPGCQYFEIGTWRGESVVNIADDCKTCVTMNLSREEMRKKGFPESSISQIGHFINKNIRMLEGNSLTFDFSSLQQQFDLVFIDGDHSYRAVYSDTLNVLKHLVHEKTIVVWHDYCNTPEKIRYEILHAIRDAVPEDQQQNLYHVAGTLCAILFPEKIATHNFSDICHPRMNMDVQLTLGQIS